MSNYSGYNQWGGGNNYQTNYGTGLNNQPTIPIPVGKLRTKHRKNVLSTKHLLQNYANEQKANVRVNKPKRSNIIQQQEPAFKLIDLEAEKKLKKNQNKEDEIELNTSNILAGSTYNDNKIAGVDIMNPSYSFSGASHIDNIFSNMNQKTASAMTIKPPTVKLSSVELGNIPEQSTNQFIQNRNEFDESLIRLANEKKTKIDYQEKRKLSLRIVGDSAWEDKSISEFDPNDFRMFVGDLGHEVTDEMLRTAFSIYPSLQRVRVIRRPGARKNRGFGFVSFKNPNDYLRAMKEMNGFRPVKCRKSTWKDRSLETVIQNREEKKKQGYKI